MNASPNTRMKSEDIIDRFYASYEEDKRLDGFSLELVRTKQIISRYLRHARMSIADIGGAAGTYSFWLAEQDHAVHLIDRAEKHIDLARRKAASSGIQLAAYRQADARELPYDAHTFDLVLLMGPLYHLQKADDRLACLKEARRVLKPGGTLIAAVISRYSSLIDGFVYGLIRDARFLPILKRDLTDGRHENPERIEHYFTHAFFHRPDDIRRDMRRAGFSDIDVIAVEGFGTMLDSRALLADEKMAPLLLEYLGKTERVPELLGVSAHLLAVSGNSIGDAGVQGDTEKEALAIGQALC